MREAFREHGTRAILSSLVLLLLPAAVLTPLSAQLGAPNDSGVSFATVHLTVREPAEHQRLWTEMFGARTTSLGSRDVIRVPGLLFVVNEGEPTGGSAGAFVDHVGFLVPDLAEGIRIGSAKDGSVSDFIVAPVPESGTVRVAETVAVDAQGNLYGGENPGMKLLKFAPLR